MVIIHVVGAAILNGDLCLVAQRGPGRPLAGLWEFPGGKVEPDERPEDALKREIQEELGVSIVVHDLVGRGTAMHAEKQIVLDVYAAELVSGELVVSEHQAVRWLRAEELASLSWAEADVPVFPMVRELMVRRDQQGASRDPL